MIQDFPGSSFGGGYTAMMHSLDLYHICPRCALQRCHGNVAFLVHQGPRVPLNDNLRCQMRRIEKSFREPPDMTRHVVVGGVMFVSMNDDKPSEFL